MPSPIERRWKRWSRGKGRHSWSVGKSEFTHFLLWIPMYKICMFSCLIRLRCCHHCCCRHCCGYCYYCCRIAVVLFIVHFSVQYSKFILWGNLKENFWNLYKDFVDLSFDVWIKETEITQWPKSNSYNPTAIFFALWHFSLKVPVGKHWNPFY
jgi:hypothetical protein